MISVKAIFTLMIQAVHQADASGSIHMQFGKGEISMDNSAGKLSAVFGAGCLGGLVNSLAVWIFGMFGITAALGVKIAPQLSAPWLYPRIVWDGL